MTNKKVKGREENSSVVLSKLRNSQNSLSRTTQPLTLTLKYSEAYSRSPGPGP